MGSVTPLSATKKSLSSETQAFLFHRRTGPCTERAGGTKRPERRSRTAFRLLQGPPRRGDGEKACAAQLIPTLRNEERPEFSKLRLFVSPPDRPRTGRAGGAKRPERRSRTGRRLTARLAARRPSSPRRRPYIRPQNPHRGVPYHGPQTPPRRPDRSSHRP